MPPIVDAFELRITEGKGEGVFATRSFGVGELVVEGVIECRLSENTAHASQVGLHEFVLLGGLASKVNHSCDPNCGVRVNDSGAYDLIARRDIVPGEEITFDYTMRNYSIEHFPAQCLCGEEICRGSITGWKDLPEERKAAYAGLVAPYLLELEAQGRFLPGHRGSIAPSYCACQRSHLLQTERRAARRRR